jgi:histidine triad (HIT) family protein
VIYKEGLSGATMEDCVFCQIVQGEKKADFVYQDDSVVAFNDVSPQAPVHVLLVPRKHIRSLNDIEEGDRSVVSELIFGAHKVAEDFGIARTGYKLIFNVERGGGQYVFHLHLHLLGGWQEGTHLRLKDIVG